MNSFGRGHGHELLHLVRENNNQHEIYEADYDERRGDVHFM